MEERARERGVSIEDFEGNLVDHVGFAKLGVQRVLERLAAGELVPDMKDGIALASLLVRMDESAGEQVDNETLVQGFMVLMEAIRRTCSQDQIDQIGGIISDNPIMAGLATRARPQPIPANGYSSR
jgi:hypothetical protein